MIVPGTIFLFTDARPQEAHLRLKPSPDFHECSLSVDRTTGERLKALHLWDFEDAIYHTPFSMEVVSRFRTLFSCTQDSTSSLGTILRTGVALISRLIEAKREMGPVDRFEQEATTLLRRRCEPAFSMHQAARELGLSYENFRKKFKRRTGRSPGDYQLLQRMNRARILLKNNSVKQTALTLGYTDPAIFSRQFKQITGVAPKHFLCP